MPWMENLSVSRGLTPATPHRLWAASCVPSAGGGCVGLSLSSLTGDTPQWCRCVSSGSSDLQLSSTASFQGIADLAGVAARLSSGLFRLHPLGCQTPQDAHGGLLVYMKCHLLTLSRQHRVQGNRSQPLLPHDGLPRPRTDGARARWSAQSGGWSEHQAPPVGGTTNGRRGRFGFGSLTWAPTQRLWLLATKAEFRAEISPRDKLATACWS